MHGVRRVVVVTIALVSGVGAAHGQARDPREAEAKTACLAGRVDRGIELLAQLYTETGEPTYIFNQGRCFEQNNRYDEAISRFREHLRKARNLRPEERRETEQHIRDCQAVKNEDRRPAPGRVDAVEEHAVEEQPPAAPDDALAERRAGRLRTAALITAGVGVAALASGVVMSLRVQSLASRFEKEHLPNQTFDREEYARGQQAQVLQWVGYGVGAAALGTALVLGYLGYEGTPGVAVGFGPHEGHGTVSWRF